MTAPPPRSTLFPYTTLFRSGIKRKEPCHVRSVQNIESVRSSDRRSRRSSGRYQDEADDGAGCLAARGRRDRKSTRLNSSHPSISYAVFCLKKKKEKFVPALP